MFFLVFYKIFFLKLIFVIQIMKGVTGLLETPEMTTSNIDLDQFVMPLTERGKDADAYVRELRNYDRI